jgi:hypothetical protein
VRDGACCACPVATAPPDSSAGQKRYSKDDKYKGFGGFGTCDGNWWNPIDDLECLGYKLGMSYPQYSEPASTAADTAAALAAAAAQKAQECAADPTKCSTPDLVPFWIKAVLVVGVIGYATGNLDKLIGK